MLRAAVDIQSQLGCHCLEVPGPVKATHVQPMEGRVEEKVREQIFGAGEDNGSSEKEGVDAASLKHPLRRKARATRTGEAAMQIDAEWRPGGIHHRDLPVPDLPMLPREARVLQARV